MTKRIITGALAALAMTLTTAMAQNTDGREHRAVWLSAYLSQGWPSSSMETESGANSQRSILTTRMAKYKAQNINVIYFHVRSNCDAMYESSYEPWSAQAGGKRGTTPAADPLQMILDIAHANGIEVYAWLNPYRYNNNISYGDNPLEYENSHPEWLIRNSTQTVLNPGLEEVKQRICDVATEIVTKYDVDGVVFDDYFYPQGGTSTGSDAPDYETYKASGTKLSIADWRRANVNEMVHRVDAAIKAVKPWMPFGISPAGVASPANVTSTYGLPPAPGGGDWQYNQIYSDPLAWLKAGDIDFISPQIYWTSRFDALTDWWGDAATKFGRHMYPSVDISAMSTGLTEEMIRETLYARESLGHDRSGMVFFHWGPFINFYEKVFDKNKNFGDNMALGAWTSKSLTPIRLWNNDYRPRMTSNVSVSGDKLTWDAVEGCRYTVYAVPQGTESSFAGQAEFLDGISYTNSYTIPKDKATGYSWAVAVYDRYGNEYSPLFAGHSVKSLPAPTLSYPADNSTPGFMFDFGWESQGTRHIFELMDGETVIAQYTVSGKSLSLTTLPKLTAGKKYNWRVRLSSPDATEAVSAVRSFTASEFALLSPTDGASGLDYDNVIVTWAKCSKGTSVEVVISDREDMSNVVYTETVTDRESLSVPARTLVSGRQYYVRATATLGDNKSTSAVRGFTTAEKTDYAAPVFVTPASEGATVYSNDYIAVAPYSGLRAVEIQIASSNSFPTRSSKKYTITDFSGKTDDLMGDCKISSKNLVNGTTYYVRARGSYYVLGSTTPKYTEYSNSSFVYSSDAGVGEVSSDAPETTYVDSEGVLHFGAGTRAVSVYRPDGSLALSHTPSAGATTLSLSGLAAGAYVISVEGAAPATLKWLK